jgi:hypothetical protein
MRLEGKMRGDVQTVHALPVKNLITRKKREKKEKKVQGNG